MSHERLGPSILAFRARLWSVKMLLQMDGVLEASEVGDFKHCTIRLVQSQFQMEILGMIL